jgi:hypothetical protein
MDMVYFILSGEYRGNFQDDDDFETFKQNFQAILKSEEAFQVQRHFRAAEFDGNFLVSPCWLV